MPTITRFEEIEAWQTARQLTSMVYGLTKSGEFARDFGLCSRMKHAAVSVMSTIAEGFENRTQLLFMEYLGRAKAPAGELRAQLYVVDDTGYLNKEDFLQIIDLCDQCSRQTSKFMNYLADQPNSISEEGINYDV
jgi:four helix bundle protein